MKSAPGSDKVKNRQLMHLPSVGKELLLKMANASWNFNEILPDWKMSKVIMIEKLVKNRLEKFIEINNIISPFRSGFQKYRSTMDDLFYLAEKIYRAHARYPKNHMCRGLRHIKSF